LGCRMGCRRRCECHRLASFTDCSDFGLREMVPHRRCAALGRIRRPPALVLACALPRTRCLSGRRDWEGRDRPATLLSAPDRSVGRTVSIWQETT
jgi:hypothetical protein